MAEPTFDVEPPKLGLDSVGPFHRHQITLDGYKVPRLEGRFNEATGNWDLVLDGRFGCEVPARYANGVVFLIANALAISAGYSHFGEGSLAGDPNKFKCRMSGISLTPDIEMEEVGEAAS